jgi:hypothetical protein
MQRIARKQERKNARANTKAMCSYYQGLKKLLDLIRVFKPTVLFLLVGSRATTAAFFLFHTQQEANNISISTEGKYFNNMSTSSSSSSGSAMSPNTDEDTLQQLRSLEEEGRALPLISSRLPLTALLPEYEHNPGAFVTGIHCLAARFGGGMRKVRGDGNCFYRALLFSYLEQLLARLQGGEGQRGEGVREQQR